MTLDLEPIGREVVNPVTGEIVDLSSASIERLAELTVDTAGYRQNLVAFEQEVSDVLLEHLDRSALWTQRVGDPTSERQFEVKAPSPSAGTENYPPDLLHDALALLIDTGVISSDAASSAMQRRLVLELDVPWDADLQALAETLKGAIGIQIEGVEVNVAKADPSSRASAAGIKALRKIPGTASALDAALVTQDPPKRRVKVSVKTRGRGA